MVGILTEKESAKRNFANALGGLSGTFNGEDFVITSARGHLYELMAPELQVPPEKAKQYSSWSIDYLPWDANDIAWKRELKADCSDKLSDIKKTLAPCDEIVIATDDDPSGEGSLLAWEILDEANIHAKKLSRMFFVDESAPEIQKAFVNRKPLTLSSADPDYRKAMFRTKFDYLSMQYTRMARACGDGRSVLRQGRLKSAMVVLVGDQLQLIKNYKAIPFYQNRFKDENGVVYISVEEPKYDDKSKVPHNFHSSSVVQDSKVRKKTAPPRLIDMAGLASLLAPKGIAASQVSAILQKLYENSYVSYPRTEDKTITPEQFNQLLPLADDIARLVGVDVNLLTHKVPRPTHVKKSGAHGANRPGSRVPKTLDELRNAYGEGAVVIYETLARSYLAMLCEDYEYDAYTGHVEDYPKFIGHCNVPAKPGWKMIYQIDDTPDDEENDQGLGTRAEPFIHQGYPKKPTEPTTKWLMKQLENRDVGTGATRTTTYAEVVNKNAKYPLLEEHKGKITMTEYGEKSYRITQGTHIADLSLTEQVYADMRGVAAGTVNEQDALSKMADWIRDDLVIMQANGASIPKPAPRVKGTWNGETLSVKESWGSHKFTESELKDLFDGKTIILKNFKTKKGYTTDIKGHLEEKVSERGTKYLQFEPIYDEKPDKMPNSWSQYTFTPGERAFLEAGDEIEIKGAISKKSGKPFDCKLRWDKDQKRFIPTFQNKKEG